MTSRSCTHLLGHTILVAWLAACTDTVGGAATSDVVVSRVGPALLAISADTCGAADHVVGDLPFAHSSTTVGAGYDYDIDADGRYCAGGGTVYSTDGAGPDVAYRIRVDNTCELSVTMDPAAEILNVAVVTDCASIPDSCVVFRDQGYGGDPETVAFTAEAGTDYFIIVDGYGDVADAFDLSISEVGDVGCGLRTLCDGSNDGTACVPADANPCTDDSCSSGVCAPVNDDTNVCSDGDGCTDDSCSDGVCAGTPSTAQSCTRCAAAPLLLGALPAVETGDTTGGADDYNLSTAGTCAGGGSQDASSGIGADALYRFHVSRTCELQVDMNPDSADMNVYVVTDCGDLASSCLAVDDFSGGGGLESVTFTAEVGIDHYVIVDGWNGAEGSYELTIAETGSIGCALSQPVVVCDGTNDGSPCHDGNDCTDNGTCSGGSCTAGTANDAYACDDGNGCTSNACSGGSCIASLTSACQSCFDAPLQAGTLPYVTGGDTTAAVDDFNISAVGTCAGGGPQYAGTGVGADEVHRIRVDQSCDLQVDMESASADMNVSVVTDCGDLASSCLGIDDAAGGGGVETVTFTASADVTYFIIVDGYNGGADTYTLTITETTATGCELVETPTACDGSNDGAPCDDALPCTDDGTCVLGACEPGPANDALSCDDGDSCTDDACSSGVCASSTTTACAACDASPLEVANLPHTVNATTNGGTDAFDLGAAGTCAGGGTQSGGTGTGADHVYRLVVDQACDLSALLTPSAADLSLYVLSSCGDLPTACLAVDDSGAGAGAETVAFSATAGVDYFLVVDGSSGGVGDYSLTIGESSAVGCRLGGDIVVCDGANDGNPCDDGNPCTDNGTCTSGACAAGPANDALSCNDGDPCTNDACLSGVCTGTETAACAACAATVPTVASLPYVVSDSTAAESDAFDLAAAGVCAGGGVQGPGTGTGADDLYLIEVDQSCDLLVELSLDDSPGVNLGLYVITDGGQQASSCVAVADSGGGGAAEQLSFSAAAVESYYLVVDGSGGDAGSYTLTISETTAVGCALGRVRCDGSNDGRLCTPMDSNPCTDDVCAAGACSPVSNDANACTDGNPCTDDACVAGVCTPTDNTDPCDDDDPCTDGDTCAAGSCAGTPSAQPPCAACAAAARRAGRLPYAVSGDTRSSTDDFNISADGTCVGGGYQYADSGVGPDDVHHLEVDRPCNIEVALDPVSADMNVTVVTHCTLLASTCQGISDGAGSGGTERVTFAAVPNVDYFLVVDGWSGGAGEYTLTLSDADGVGCRMGEPLVSCDGSNDGKLCDDGNPCTDAGTCAGGACAPGPADDTLTCDDEDTCTTDACLAGTCVSTVKPACEACAAAPMSEALLPHTVQGDTADSDGATEALDLAAAGTCAGGGSQANGSGTGPEHVYDIHVDRTCELRLRLLPEAADLTLYVVTDCGNLATSCVAVDDRGSGGGQEEIIFTAATGTHYHAVVDGYDGAAGAYTLEIAELGEVGCTLGETLVVCDGSNDGGRCVDGNPCTEQDTCSAGTCVGTPNDALPCDDGNPCTDDVCTAGVCESTNDDANRCSDGVPCTEDACVAGACLSAQKDCSALDGVCLAGFCNEATGFCEATAANDGGTCDDGSACTQSDTCQAGVCAGVPMDCTALDGPCAVGHCDSATGQCTALAKDCSATAGPCARGVCNPTTGACEPEPHPDGSACDDGDACTDSDRCTAGVCAGAAKACSDACNTGQCNPASGLCERTPTNEGGGCDDSDPCTEADVCGAGVCGGVAVDCSSLDAQCVVGICASDSGQCDAVVVNEDGPCDDGDPCTKLDVCVSGVCVGTAKDCSLYADACNVGRCNPASGLCEAAPSNAGGPCDAGDDCSATCQEGLCVPDKACEQGNQPPSDDDSSPATAEPGRDSERSGCLNAAAGAQSGAWLCLGTLLALAFARRPRRRQRSRARRCLSSRALLALLCAQLGACSEPFLRQVVDAEPPNDDQSCAPATAVSALAAQVHETWVTLEWALAQAEGRPDAATAQEDGVIIERRLGDAIVWGEIARLPARTETFNDYGIAANHRYVYRGRTFRTFNNELCASLDSNEREVTTFPASPSALQARMLSADSLELSWLDDNGYESGFRIERQVHGEGFAPVGERSADTTLFVDGAVQPGLHYDYRVSAFNAAGASAPAETSLRTSSPPQLRWVGAPELDPTCTLSLAGEVTLDVQSGATVASVAGAIASGTSGYDDTVLADAAGVSAQLTDLSERPLQVSWSVADSLGASAEIDRHLTVTVNAVHRALERAPATALGDGSQSGSQALLPGCSACSGPRGALALGARFGCAVRDDQRVRCWGRNTDAQAGRGHRGARLVPATVCADADCHEPLVAIDLAVNRFGGYGPTCVRTPIGELRCWGDNSYGQLGSGHSIELAAPAYVCREGAGADCPPLAGVRQVVLAETVTCALLDSGRVRCFGDDDGPLGMGQAVTDLDGPVAPGEVCATGDWDGASCVGGAPLEQVVALAAGKAHVCALLASTDVVCWGENDQGQLGDGSTQPESNPASVCTAGQWDGTRCWDGHTEQVLSDVTSIVAGGQHTCALLTDGSLRCWGDNYEGQLGDGTSDDRSAPVSVCVAGAWDGTQCSDGGTDTGLTQVTSVVAGGRHTCAIVGSDQQVLCWGDAGNGRLGNGTTGPDAHNPAPVCTHSDGLGCPRLRGARALSAGGSSTCAVLASSEEVWCWGSNYEGELGTGATGDALNPQRLCRRGTDASCEPLVEVAMVVHGEDHGCALPAASGEVLCWGDGGWSELGRGNGDPAYTPGPVCDTESGGPCVGLEAIALAAGAAHACAVRPDGAVQCWGDNLHGELGNGTAGFTAQQGPAPVCATGAGDSCEPLTGALAVAAGGAARSAEEDRWCSDGTLRRRCPVDGTPLYGHTCAVMADGTLRCWGDNRHGQLGIGTFDATGASCEHDDDCQTDDRCVCECEDSECGDVACRCLFRGTHCSDDSQCIRGTRYCDGGHCLLGSGSYCGMGLWCEDPGEQCIRGETDTYRCRQPPAANTNPMEVACGTGVEPDCIAGAPLGGVVGVTNGWKHTCALLEGGRVKCWGDNEHGQLGPGSIVAQSLPLDVPVQDAVALSAGALHTCALSRAAEVSCWGANAHGQLGSGTTGGFRTLPAKVCAYGSGLSCAPLTGVVAIAAGDFFTCALLGNGTVRCWGDNSFGQHGVGVSSASANASRAVCAPSAAPETPPDGASTAVCAAEEAFCAHYLSDAVAIEAGDHHACALRADGTITCWGRGSEAQLGTGPDTAGSSDPVRCEPTLGVCLPGRAGCSAEHVDASFAVRVCDLVSVTEVQP